MQDYDGPPGYPGYHPLIGQGAWPDRWVNLLALVLLVLVAAAMMAAHRAGQRSRVDYLTGRRRSAIRIIFDDVRYELDRALLATGERSFGPAQAVLEAVEFYLAPLLLVGKELGGPVRELRNALDGKVKKPAHHAGHEGHGAHKGGEPAVVIAADPSTVSASAAGAGAASASVSGPFGGVTVLQPARVVEIGGGDHHEPPEPTVRERVQAVREALEGLSEYWERGRVKAQLSAVHDALSDARARPGRSVHLGYAAERPVRRRGGAGFDNAVAKAERDANGGFPWFKF